SGDKTHFLPFNLGDHGHVGNPPAAEGGYRTAYLWREVWQRDSRLDILGRFMHLQVEEKRILTDEGIRKTAKETMIFPRNYQLDHKQDVVQKIDEDTRQLVQALANGTPIVIPTLQKLPFISETLEKLHKEDHPGLAISTKDKQCAVIVDEAHGSQSGESAM